MTSNFNYKKGAVFVGFFLHIIIFLPIYVTIWLLCGSVYGVFCMLKGYEKEGSVFRNNWEFTKSMVKQFKVTSLIVALIVVSLSINISNIVKEKRYSYDNYIDYHIGTLESNFFYSVNRLTTEVRLVINYLEGHLDYYREDGLENGFHYSMYLNPLIKQGKQYDYYLQHRYRGYESTDFTYIKNVYNEIFQSINDDIISGESRRIDKAIEDLKMIYHALSGYKIEEEEEGIFFHDMQNHKEFSSYIKRLSAVGEGR